MRDQAASVAGMSRPTIFTPDELATIAKRVAAGDTSQEIAATYEVDRKTILHVVRFNKLGPWHSRVVPDQSRAMPGDFADHAAKPMKDLKRRYSAGDSTVRKWRKQLALAVPSGPKVKQMPAGFAEMQQGKSIIELSEIYRCGKLPVSRWLKELGIKRERFVSVPRLKPAKPAHLVRNAYMTTPVDRAIKDGSRAGLAAEFLKKYGPVYRCTAMGATDPKGTHWRRNSSILTDAEIIERAEYNGWSADAWKQVA